MQGVERLLLGDGTRVVSGRVGVLWLRRFRTASVYNTLGIAARERLKEMPAEFSELPRLIPNPVAQLGGKGFRVEGHVK